MGVFDIFSYSKPNASNIEEPLSIDTTVVGTANAQGDSMTKNIVPVPAPTTIIPIQAKPLHDKTSALVEIPTHAPQITSRRFSFRRPFGFANKASSDDKPTLSATREHQKRTQASQDLEKRVQKFQASKTDKRAQRSALAVRALIIGSASAVPPKITATTAKPQINAFKSQLMEPKSANKVIAHLRTLPAHDGDLTEEDLRHNGPIHAVCLEHTDEEEHQLHFAKLKSSDAAREISTENVHFPGVAFAPLDEITNMFNEMHVVDLLSAPGFGLGQPGNGKGILAGAVPTAQTVIQGFKQITPELMALGYATGKVITPNHSGLHPPTDRMSILTYWWGFELLLPPPSLEYLTKAQSISGSVMNFLSAVALINNGVREILPFIRYIAQFVDYEFKSIKAKDDGRGVICAATWIIPAALVPRPWDFPEAPEAPLMNSGGTQPSTLPERAPPSLPPASVPTVSSSLLDIVATTSISSSPVKSRGLLFTAKS